MGYWAHDQSRLRDVGVNGRCDPRRKPGNPLVRLRWWHCTKPEYWPPRLRKLADQQLIEPMRGIWVMSNKIPQHLVPVSKFHQYRKFWRGFSKHRPHVPSMPDPDTMAPPQYVYEEDADVPTWTDVETDMESECDDEEQGLSIATQQIANLSLHDRAEPVVNPVSVQLRRQLSFYCDRA